MLVVYAIPGIFGALTNGLTAHFLNGEITLDDLLIGFTIGTMGVVIEFTIAKWIPDNFIAQVTFDGAVSAVEEFIEWEGKKIEVGKTLVDTITTGFDLAIDFFVDNINAGLDWFRGLFNR